MIFNISLHYFLKKYLLTFPVRKSRKVVTVFSAIIRFWGWLLIFSLSPLLYHFPTQFLFCAGWMICLKGLEMRSKLNFIPSYSFNDHSWLLHDYCLTCQNQSPSSGHIICGIKGEISSLLIQTIISKEEEEAVSQLKAQCYYVCNFVLHFYGVHHFSCF